MTKTTTVKVSKRYQISIPALARQLLNIQSDAHLQVDIQDGMIILIPRPESCTETLAGLHQEIWLGVDAQKYSDEERDAWAGSA